MEHVEDIDVSRVNSLSPFGQAVMEEQGVGLTVAEYDEKMKNNALAGHVGFAESINMIAKALGWNLDKVTQQMKPIITDVDRKSVIIGFIC